MEIIDAPSPNFNDRPEGITPSLLIMHYTGMKTGEEALARMCAPEAQVAAHYMVEEDGRVFKLVDEDKRAWHAGVSSWHGETDINGISIGIEIVNPGHEFGYRDFPSVQMEAVIALAKDIIARWNIAAHRVVGHSDVAPARKQDPGEKFNWKLLAHYGIGVWPSSDPKKDKIALHMGDMGQQVSLLQQQLAAIGYGIEDTGVYDDQTRDVVAAVQRHWRQDAVTGEADTETQSILDVILLGGI